MSLSLLVLSLKFDLSGVHRLKGDSGSTWVKRTSGVLPLLLSQTPNHTKTTNSEVCLCTREDWFSLHLSFHSMKFSVVISILICFWLKSRLDKVKKGLKKAKSLLPKRNDDISFQEGLFEMWIKHLILSPVAK